jgi:hypothetical protein
MNWRDLGSLTKNSFMHSFTYIAVQDPTVRFTFKRGATIVDKIMHDVVVVVRN